MVALPESCIEIDGIHVDRRIFTTPFICDVIFQNCGSACCQRGSIMTPVEIARIKPHMEGIAQYLPVQKQELLEREGGEFIEEPDVPLTDVTSQEQWAMIRFFKSAEEMRCTWVTDDGCVFLHQAPTTTAGSGRAVKVQRCAVHSYAVDRGLDWRTFKQADCVQYPLYVYRQDGRTVLALQEVPGHAQVPCLNNPVGPLMYRSLSASIVYLLGADFNEQLQAYGHEHFPE
jgi:hypothetical protein